jgi:type II secretory pathway component PulM
MSNDSGVQQALAPLRGWWRGLALRERRMLVLAVALLVFLLLWLFAVRPAWRTINDAPQQIDALDARLQTMQRAATEATELRCAARQRGSGDSRAEDSDRAPGRQRQAVAAR